MEPSLTIVEGLTAVGLEAEEAVFLTGVETVFFTSFFFVAVGGADEVPICSARRDINRGIIVSTNESTSVDPERDFSTEDFSNIFLVACSSSFGFFLVVFLTVPLSEEDLVSWLLRDRDRCFSLSSRSLLLWPLGGVYLVGECLGGV